MRGDVMGQREVCVTGFGSGAAHLGSRGTPASALPPIASLQWATPCCALEMAEAVRFWCSVAPDSCGTVQFGVLAGQKSAAVVATIQQAGYV